MLAMATLATPFLAGTASAADTYVGLSRTTPGEAYVNFPAAKNVENQNSPLAMKLYGGIDLTDRYGIEMGYGFFGTHKTTDPTPGSRNEYRLSSRLIYVAGKASMPISESFSLFAKLGVAANTVSSESNLQASSRYTFIRPMAGFGVSYNLTKNIAGVLEYNYYGASKNFRQQKVELGLKYSF